MLLAALRAGARGRRQRLLAEQWERGNVFLLSPQAAEHLWVLGGLGGRLAARAGGGGFLAHFTCGRSGAVWAGT